MNKVIETEKAYDLFCDGQKIMIGGFAEVGTPFTLIDGLIERNIKDLEIIVNDAGRPKMAGVAPLFERNMIRKAIISFLGSNPDAGRQLEANEFEIELVPQGTLCERIRCGGSGLGGVLVRTGVGTDIAEGKETIVIDEVEYLLEKPLRAELALIHAKKADTEGNMIFRRLAKNFNPVMATAADIVIVEAEEIVDYGVLDPDEISLAGIYADYVIQAKEK